MSSVTKYNYIVSPLLFVSVLEKSETLLYHTCIMSYLRQTPFRQDAIIISEDVFIVNRNISE